jgi:hypothetical protein
MFHSIVRREASFIEINRTAIGRFCCLPIQVRKLWELTFAYRAWHTAVEARRRKTIPWYRSGIREDGPSKLFVQWTCGRASVRLLGAHSIWRVEPFGELKKRRLS